MYSIKESERPFLNQLLPSLAFQTKSLDTNDLYGLNGNEKLISGIDYYIFQKEICHYYKPIMLAYGS